MVLTLSGQNIEASHDLTPNGGLVREISLFPGNQGWRNIIIWPNLARYFADVRKILIVNVRVVSEQSCKSHLLQDNLPLTPSGVHHFLLEIYDLGGDPPPCPTSSS